MSENVISILKTINLVLAAFLFVMIIYSRLKKENSITLMFKIILSLILIGTNIHLVINGYTTTNIVLVILCSIFFIANVILLIIRVNYLENNQQKNKHSTQN